MYKFKRGDIIKDREDEYFEEGIQITVIEKLTEKVYLPGFLFHTDQCPEQVYGWKIPRKCQCCCLAFSGSGTCCPGGFCRDSTVCMA